MPRRIYFLTTMPQYIEQSLNQGVLDWAVRSAKVVYQIVNLRDFAIDDRGTIDGRPYGGGDGMIFRPEPVVLAVESLALSEAIIIVPSPAGHIWNQEAAEITSQDERPLIWICPRFGGIDQRAIEILRAQEYSIGNFVVSCGELPALLMTDSIVRLLPGVLGATESASHDSFSEAYDRQIEEPQYTRPGEFRGLRVPSVLTSGHAEKIKKWRHDQRQLRYLHLKKS
jgi:tRNA (guanine37-N1)-methyltransferase